MILLNGNTLGARQRELNDKVNEAVRCDASFDSFDTSKPEPDKTEADVDILFKIDLAAKYKNIHYIIEILKSGDNLYIKRALKKCLWLGDYEFDVFMNVNNLHDNIFPHMSVKMKKKLLCLLSMCAMDESRAIEFHEYCMKVKLYNPAMKFLLKTSESYKRDVILKKSEAHSVLFKYLDNFAYNVLQKKEELILFIGNSFLLADVYLEYLEISKTVRNIVLYILRHLFAVSETQYLDLLEKYTCVEYTFREPFRLGKRLSKKIMKSHKDRVLKNSLIYVNTLEKTIIVRNSTVNDVKAYAVRLLPEKAFELWQENFYTTYKFILDKIPVTERFSYIKQIFTNKYVSEPFETCVDFYNNDFFNMMTTEEREDWALQRVASGEELLGSGNDYLWYKFVTFQKALEEIKKFILITPDNEKRLEILKVLIDSAKSENDLKTLLNYYYNRHVNELKHHKEHFINSLMVQHKVLNFNEECWLALEKIFYSLEVFNKLNYDNCDSDYKVIALIYYITRKDTVLEVLNEYIDMGIISLYHLRSLSCDLGDEKEEIIFQYFLQFYLTKVEALNKETSNDDTEKKFIGYIHSTLELLFSYKKDKDSIPEIMNTYIKLNRETFKEDSFFYEPVEKFSKKDIVRSMKNDATNVINQFPKIKTYIEDGHHTNWLVRKLKIYFHHDIAPQYLQLVHECLSPELLHYSLVKYALYAIFHLADESYKVDLMEKYYPTDATIDHASISQKTLNMQRAICSQACFSRPPLPMKNLLRFITGDYVQHCLPIFNSYLMNLPHPQCITFVESLINKPISIQKHGLRLAFACFDSEKLVSLTIDAWKKSKNVSLRKIIYKMLFDKVVKESGPTQLELFEILKTITMDLNQDDDQEVFGLITNHKMTYDLMGHYLVSAWEAVKRFPERTVNFNRMENVISAIEQWLHMVPEDVLIAITDEHVSDMLDKKQILSTDVKEGQKQLHDAKWKLTDRYLTFVYKKEQIKRNLEVIKHITKRITEMWSEVRNETYVLREFCSSFLIKDLEAKSYSVHAVESYSNVNIMCKAILKLLQDSLPKPDTYLLTWQLRLSIIAREIIIVGKQELKNANDEDQVVKAIKTGVLRFAEAFGTLVREYIKCGKYYASFHDQIQFYVSSKLIFINSNLDYSSNVNYNLEDLHVIMCTGLLKFKVPEIYMYIAKVLPSNYWYQNSWGQHQRQSKSRLIKDYEKVLRLVMTYKNEEIQYYMYNKFLLDDFQFRKYIHELCSKIQL